MIAVTMSDLISVFLCFAVIAHSSNNNVINTGINWTSKNLYFSETCGFPNKMSVFVKNKLCLKEAEKIEIIIKNRILSIIT